MHVAGGAGAASAAGVFELDAEVHRDVENRFGLAVLVVGKLSGLELDRLADIGERNLGHNFHCSVRRAGILVLSCFIFWKNALRRRLPRGLSRCTASTGPVQTEQPKQSSFGEIAVPAAFQLARQLKKAPKAIAGGVVGGGGCD